MSDTYVHVSLFLKLAKLWEETPPHFLKLDVTSLLSDSNIDEVWYMYYVCCTMSIGIHVHTYVRTYIPYCLK